MSQKSIISNIIIEMTTPLNVGSSDIDFLLDSPVQRDWNGLPMILGSSISGAIRSKFIKNEEMYSLFGDDIEEQKQVLPNKSEKDVKGSRIVISNALLCDENMQVCEELLLENKSDFLNYFRELPVRDHNRINDKGVVEDSGKFDEEIIFKGARFKFRIEIFGAEKELKDELRDIIFILRSEIFRLGGGATKGFGAVRVLDELSSWQEFDINSDEYRNTSSSLNCSLKKSLKELQISKLSVLGSDTKKLNRYTLKLKPDDFFMFGSGFGDLQADMTPVKEHIVCYDGGKGAIKESLTLLPASSIKGAILHRSIYHLNLLDSKFIGYSDTHNNLITIFGTQKGNKEFLDGKKGKILMSDLFIEVDDERVFEHVAIDRFRGGAKDGALFQEKTSIYNKSISLEILVYDDIDSKEQKAFENALNDICNGMLPLGGATTKGHGFFSGKVFKNGEDITQKGFVHDTKE